MVYPKARFARNKDGNVAYQIVGDGPRDLVFVPWWTSSIDIIWEEPSITRFLNRLASFSRVLCFDKRGAGVSDPVPLAALPTLEQWIDDVRSAMQAAGSELAALLGHVHGGQMAMLFAATYPKRTSALILVDSCARQYDDDEHPGNFAMDRLTHSLDEVEAGWGSGAGLGIFAPRLAHDKRFQGWYARYLAVHIAGARLVELAGEDHLFDVGETEAMLGEVEEFLTGVRPVREVDRARATVLVTDIVGSTERAAALGDHAWRVLLDAHHALRGIAVHIGARSAQPRAMNESGRRWPVQSMPVRQSAQARQRHVV